MKRLRQLIDRLRIFRRLRKMQAVLDALTICAGCGVVVYPGHGKVEVLPDGSGAGRAYCQWCKGAAKQQRAQASLRAKNRGPRPCA